MHTLPALGVDQDVLSVPIPQPHDVSHAGPNGRRPAEFFFFSSKKQKRKYKPRRPEAELGWRSWSFATVETSTWCAPTPLLGLRPVSGDKTTTNKSRAYFAVALRLGGQRIESGAFRKHLVEGEV